MSADSKKRVLFLCTGNSARSQMAEALLKDKAGDIFDVYSAGTKPEKIDKRTITAIEKLGITTDGLTSKSVDVFIGQKFDFVITLCNKANHECKAFSGTENQLAWDFPDPKSRKGLAPFSTTLNDINNRLSMFIELESQNIETTIKPTHDDPTALFKCLTDDIRLKTLLLTDYFGELCVCELMEALCENSQPKVSRNLAVLKNAGIITGRKHGQWVFYRINNNLPLWMKNVISLTLENNTALISPHIERLSQMNNRPDKVAFCNEYKLSDED